MPGRYSFGAVRGGGSRDPWFRVNQYDVNTTTLVTALSGLSMLVWAISPAALVWLVQLPSKVRGGQLWRIATWPLANPPSIWTVITLYIFWLLGTQLENTLGRFRFLGMLAALTIVPAIVGVLIDVPQAGIRTVELGVFVAYALENPRTRFMFNIPAWIMAAVIVGIEVLQLSGNRDGGGIVLLFVLLATAIVMLKSLGMGSDLPSWVPRVPLPGMAGGFGKANVRRKPGPAKRAKDLIKRAEKAEASVTDISTMRPMEVSPEAKRARQAKIDGILDKISAQGINSLDEEELRILKESKR
jgi:membrane associated rhomboid family serine protease